MTTMTTTTRSTLPGLLRARYRATDNGGDGGRVSEDGGSAAASRSAIGTAYRYRTSRAREEREADEAEADFVLRMEREQIVDLGMAVFVPGPLSVLVISTVATLGERFGTRDLLPALPAGLGNDDDGDGDGDRFVVGTGEGQSATV